MMFLLKPKKHFPRKCSKFVFNKCKSKMTKENNLEKENGLESSKNQNNTKGILSDINKGDQTVFSLFGIKLTAPAGLKNPGIIYISFIAINFILFLVLKSFINT